MLDFKKRCPIDPEAVPAVPPGAMAEMFQVYYCTAILVYYYTNILLYYYTTILTFYYSWFRPRAELLDYTTILLYSTTTIL